MNQNTLTSQLRLFLGVTALSAVALWGYAQTTYSSTFCDPGDHFIDGCAAGTNYVEGRLDVGIDITLDGIADFDGQFIGYVRLVRSDPLDDSLNFPGTRPVDGHNGVIDLEMPSMRSTGVDGTPTQGWTIRTGRNSGVTHPTFGAAAECEAAAQDCVDHFEDPSWAHSVFHLFFEIDIPGLGTLHNYHSALPGDNAFLIGTEILSAPPSLGTLFIPVNSSTPFYDENGIHQANVTDTLSTRGSGSSRHLKNLNASLTPYGTQGDGLISLVYDAATGEMRVDVPVDVEINSLNIDSASGIFTGEPAQNLDDNSDNNDTDDNIIKSTSGGSFGSTSFGNVAATGLLQGFLLTDLSVVGSLAGGAGAFGDFDLVYLAQGIDLGACCIDGECSDGVLDAECEAGGGLFQGAATTCAVVDCAYPVPTVSEWGLMVLTVLLLTGGAVVFGRRRRSAAA